MEFNFDEDGREDIRRRNCAYILVGTDALAWKCVIPVVCVKTGKDM